MTSLAARPSVVVVGAINVDHVLNVERFPIPGEGVDATADHEGFGGKGANAATAAALDVREKYPSAYDWSAFSISGAG